MKIEAIQGDITNMDVTAIVNAANSSLLGGGGVDGAIHRAAGPELLDECRKIRARQGGCKTGEAVITTAGKLTAQYVIHTVGPVWQGGKAGEEELLAGCYKNCLKLAEDHQVDSIAFPNISTGIYRFPKAEAAAVAIETIKNHQPEHVKKVIFVCFDQENLRLYQQLLENEND